MIEFSVFLICGGIFLSAFTISFAIVSQFVDNIILTKGQPETPGKFQYFYNQNFIDYAEVVDASNNDYIEGMYEEETPVGKVIMTYDDETDVFNYYCDRYIPNKMLEVVCRGFVLKYECYNKLVDYTEEGIKRYSVLQKVKMEEERLKNDDEKKDGKENDNDKDLFANMKPYNMKKSENSTSHNDIMIKTNFNKFKNNGRLDNYTTKHKEKLSMELKREPVSYKDFKDKSN